MYRSLIVCLALSLQGCIGPPDTFDDMWDQLDQVAIPDDFTLVGEEYYGARSRAGAAPPPTVTRTYSARWDNSGLCDRISALLGNYGRVETYRAGTCGFRTTIPSGWRARFVSVSRYDLSIYARSPETVTNLSADRCAEARSAYEDSHPEGSYLFRPEECWVPPGEAYVSITVHGKEGW